MSRTIKDIDINKNRDSVREIILNWADINGFSIVENLPAFLKLVKGRVDLVGEFNFEISLQEKNHKCILHGEFYSRFKSGYISPARELELTPKIKFYGGIGKKRGYRHMINLLEYMQDPMK